MSSENNSDFTGEDTCLPRSKLAFDFRVVERPIYKPNSGPPLQSISLIPPHELKGIILDCFPYPKPNDPSHFLVGYEREPHNRIIIHPNNIRNYVSEYTLENWEHERSTAEENRLIKELQPRLIVSEKARVLRELKKAGKSRDDLREEDAEQYQALGMPKKRGRPKSMASVFKPAPKPVSDQPSGKRGPGRPRKVVSVQVVSPTISHPHRPSLSQPSLSQPSLSQSFAKAPRAMLEHTIADSASEEEDEDTDLALDDQHNQGATHISNTAMNSSTILRVTSPATEHSSQGQVNKTPIQSPQKYRSFKMSPHDRPKKAAILPGMSVDAYPYDNLKANASNNKKSIKFDKGSSTQNQSPASLQLPLLSSGEQSTGRTVQGTSQKPQSKIVDYFKDSGTKIPASKTLDVNRNYEPSSSLKRKSSPFIGREGESSGKSRSKTRRLGKGSDDYYDAEYKGASKKRSGSPTIENCETSSEPRSSARRGSDAFNLRSSRSRSRRLESSPGNRMELEDENEDAIGDMDEDEGEQKGEQAAFGGRPPTWDVKSILDHKYEWNDGDNKQELWYLVDWKGDWNPTWEPANGISEGAVDDYIASRQAQGLGNLSVSIDAIDIGGNSDSLSRGDDLECSIEDDGYS
ncbi:uncharacterized protein EAE98_005202 [Botrytis deweyae]|uniref:Chromo domain-containing protein n=1 Tax=Botrytis deweyae TaxID=2478750 RepID=A0ABQ7INP8_9HELO|nr:uncharacterized protein EAE98_005202 [Botrytis deweyae]KAF7929283.1 hypothetical protein EAE98_005202 [Botrytis deweyae]